MFLSLRTSSRRLWLTLFLAAVSLFLSGLAVAQSGQTEQPSSGSSNATSPVQRTWVMKPTMIAQTPPLYQIHDQYVSSEFKDAEEVKVPGWLKNPAPANPSFEDPALQLTYGPMISVNQGLSFDGIGESFTGPNGTYSVGSVPPDTDMATGTTQVVSLDNTGFAVFNKTTGAVLLGPLNTNTLWSSLGSGSECFTENDGDGIVKFDQLAQRWIITQFALGSSDTGPFFQCVAISQTDDATGSWTVLQFTPGTNGYFPDYPKLGVWPDAYSITFDMFNSTGSTYEGAAICGIDRINLLKGNSPTIVCAQLQSTDYALLPVDLDGPTYPAPGAKEIYIENSGANGSSTLLYMYRAKYNFTAGTVAVDSRISITVSTYANNTCSNTQKCVPQPTHTGTVQNGTFASESKLDTLAAHQMYRAAYRNFGSYESVLLSGPVLPSGSGGSGSNTAERWYELRGINTSGGTGTPTVFQQSTFSPDTSLYRWMGSIAQDNQGNILMGYSGSSSSVFPSIYITGRVPTDALNTMEAESKVYAGLNSQVNLSGLLYGYRWGDYTAMMMDTDDCTFWFTGEYLKQAGLFNWSTRILSFSFPSCSSNGAITSPVPSSTLTSGTATFLWLSGTGTPSYTLAIGKTQGGSDYCGGPQNYNAGTYTATLSCLPTDGSTFWVRLTTVGGANGHNDYQYTAASLQQPQTITFPNPGPLTYGTAAVTLTATATSGLPVTYSVISGPGSVSGSSLTVTGAGTIVVEADQAGNSQWQAAPPVQDSIIVNKATLTVTANNASITEGSPLPTFTASYSGFVNGDGQGVLSGSPSLTTNAPQDPPVGTYTITAAQGTLSAQNYNFTFVNGTLTVTAAVAQITSPPKHSTLTSSTATFTWSHETGATSYQLWLGHSAGAHDITTIGTSGLTATITGLPTDGSLIYATLYGYANNSWTVEDTAVYTAATIVNAQITAPTKGSTLTGDTATFTWTAETGATSYQVWVGTTPGGKDIAATGTSGLTLTVSGLPVNGSQVYVTLYGYAGAIWSVQDTATYTAASPAQITSPPKGSTLTGSTATFTWTAESGATSYQLWVGTTPGGHDLAVVGTSNLSATVGGLPTNGSTIYVTLYGYAGGSWTVQDSASYTAVSVANAQITSPPKGSTLPGDTVTFTWTAESGATSYQLWVGSAAGQDDLGVGGTTGLSATMGNLPTDGRQVFVTLYGYAGGVWSVQDTAVYSASGGSSRPSGSVKPIVPTRPRG